MTMTAADKNRRVFDARFRRATIANDDFDQSLRIIAGAYQAGEIPADWGVQVRQTMAHIRKAKTLLTKAISDADPIVQDKSVGPEEVVEIHRSVGYLNGRLQRVIAVEESLLNSLLAGDADYTSLYLDAQRVQQSFEERIHQEAYGDYADPEDFSSDDVGYEEQEVELSEDPEVGSVDECPEEEGDVSVESDHGDLPEGDIEYDGTDSDDDSADAPSGCEGHSREPEPCTDDGVGDDCPEEEPGDDDDPEAPVILQVPEEEEPLDESPAGPASDPVDGLSTEEKVRMILSDPEIQAVIRDAAHRQAMAEIEALRSEAVTPGEEDTPAQERTSVMERPEPRVIVTTRGEDIPASEFPGGSSGQSDSRSGLVGRIRVPRDDKPEKPRKNRLSRKNTGGEQ